MLEISKLGSDKTVPAAHKLECSSKWLLIYFLLLVGCCFRQENRTNNFQKAESYAEIIPSYTGSKSW